jgi:hypothetical protein
MYNLKFGQDKVPSRKIFMMTCSNEFNDIIKKFLTIMCMKLYYS